MTAKKTTTATKTAVAKKTSAKKPAATKQPATTTKATTAKRPTTKPDAKKKVSQIEAALTVLKKSREPLSCKEMVGAMAKAKVWTSPGGKTPDATLYAAILRDLRNGNDARFTKAAPDRFTNA